MRLSETVTAMFGNLSNKEALLLSIHFELAKNK
jgi:PRD domain protein (TIGR03582 family)